MCGIVGFIDHRSKEVKLPIINQMMDKIIHRGPNSAGHFVDDKAALGFRRLSIIDLEGGSQPIYNEDKTKVLTFNGEIYNFQTIREDLINKGHIFTTQTDSEVLLHGYEEYGPNLLKKLRGMFAFVIWDTEKQELFGARDHFGIKPLYYTLMDGTFMYGSEIKSFLEHPDFHKEINKEALKPYMTFQYSALKETFFKNVYRIEEGHYFIYRNGNFETHQYWDMHPKEADMTLEETVDLIDKTVLESVEAHKIADVEVGSFLSSGVDSSYVASVLRPDKTYSIGFGDHSYNESNEAKALTDMIDLKNISRVVTGDEAFENFPLIQYYLDEPDSNPSCVPLFFLAELASRDVPVVMSGEGADELFAGYIDYGFNSNSKVIRKVGEVLKKLPKGLRYNLATMMEKAPNFKGKFHLYRSIAPAEAHFIGQARIFEEKEALEYLTDDYKKAPSVKDIVKEYYNKARDFSEIKKMQYLDIHQWQPKDILLKADKMSMAHSLEVRVPLLDTKVMEVAETVPTKYLINEENTKYAFRLAAKKHLPEEWSNRPKLGFPVPIKDWLQEEKYYLIVKELFEQDFVKEFFDQAKILDLLEKNYQGQVNARRKIWTIYSFLTWYDVYFMNDGKKPETRKV